jgi:hypothetical protein
MVMGTISPLQEVIEIRLELKVKRRGWWNHFFPS